jgi:hypothetical protein
MYEVNHFQKPVSVPLPTMYDPGVINLASFDSAWRHAV